MEDKYALRHIFFREFVRELIRNTNSANIEIEKLSKTERKPSIQKTHLQSLKKIELKPTQIPQQIRSASNKMQMSPKPSGEINTFPKPGAGTPIVIGQSKESNLGKITSILKDPRVQNIECPGPNKNLLVRKNGIIQTTRISLNKKDIKKVINEFSEKTRIPVVNGLLKAALGNIIITAVESDYIGSRFIIQKKNAFPTII